MCRQQACERRVPRDSLAERPRHGRIGRRRDRGHDAGFLDRLADRGDPRRRILDAAEKRRRPHGPPRRSARRERPGRRRRRPCGRSAPSPAARAARPAARASAPGSRPEWVRIGPTCPCARQFGRSRKAGLSGTGPMLPGGDVSFARRLPVHHPRRRLHCRRGSSGRRAVRAAARGGPDRLSRLHPDRRHRRPGPGRHGGDHPRRVDRGGAPRRRADRGDARRCAARRPPGPLSAPRPDRRPSASRHPARPGPGRGADAPRSLRRHHRGADHGRRSALDRRARPRRARRRDCRSRPVFRRGRRRAELLRGPAHRRRSAPAGRPARRPGRRRSTSRTDLPLAIARARGTGAGALKIYANLPPALVGRLAAEAHRQGLLVWAHGAVFPTAPERGDRRRPRRRLPHLLSRLPALRPAAAKLSAALSRQSGGARRTATIRS